ncbi:hypothetical protein FNF27_02116 [Cafeteria roenbergensis]|nr:hypothetical protein FNF31_01328 [Cafeteria roenbergensis]KAA0170273.1 hypothetical protein FNF28_01501 [Cafeteria roenbergensis]KAA0176420.1 hypothetical protein FNF27_02116 [Cafeteria roenbergensis]
MTGDPAGKCAVAASMEPGFAMAMALEAFFIVMSGGANGRTDERVVSLRRRLQYLVDSHHCNFRERSFVAALHAWSDGRIREAAAILEGWLLEQPHDVLAVRVLHDTYYFLGDAEQLRDSPGRVMGGWDAQRPGYLKLCGMFAFGAQECRQFALAEEQGMRALSEEMEDPWALHAVVHVYESLGRRYEGQRLLRTSRWFWDSATLLNVHLHWHWGLMQLGDGQFERAMGRYDEWLREDSATEALNVCDAASLLWRMELLGIDAFDRWAELVPLVRRFMGQHVMPYVDVHIAMVLAAAGEESLLADHLASMRSAALRSPLFEPAMSSTVTAPLGPEAMRQADPAWGFLHREEALPESARAEPSEAPDAPSESGLQRPRGREGTGPLSPAVRVADEHVAGPDPPSLRDSPFSAFAPASERRSVVLRSNEEFSLADAPALPLGSEMDPDAQDRPIIPVPMSTLPVLPLEVRVPDFGAVDDGTLPEDAANDPGSLPTRPELVSIGGVGGLGLGSHSLVDPRYVAASVGLAVAEGMAAYRTGRSDEAVSRLLPARSSLSIMGGSRAQRDVFSLTLEAAATQSRRMLLARALLRERATNAPNDGHAMYHLSSVLFATGDYRQAAQSRDRALRFGLGQARHMARQAHPEGAMPKNLEPFRTG